MERVDITKMILQNKARKLVKIIILAVILLVPSCISFAVVFEIRALRNEVTQLQETVTVYQSVYTDNDALQEDSVETEAEALENQQISSDIGQESDEWTDHSGIRKVYLTFDDGPSLNTDKILDILNEYGVKATFFVVGKEGYTEEYQRIVKEGHTLGMHSYSHKYREIYQSIESYKEDLSRLHSFLYEVAGVDSKIVRFPGGSSNTISKVDMKDLIDYLNQEGSAYFDWNVSSGDASSNYISASQIADNVLNNVWKYDSVVVLMHDSATKDTTVEALPIIIEKILESENTVLLPISEDTIPVQHVHGN